jgi:FAD/FMN-containing dehydrogenase
MQWFWTPFTQNATLLLREEVPLSTPIVPCWPGDLERAHKSRMNVTCTDWSYKALAHENSFDETRPLYTEMEYFVDIANADALVKDFRAFQQSVAAKSECRVGSVQSMETGQTSMCSLFTGVRYGKKDSMWLSPMFDRNIAVVSMIVSGPSHLESGPKREVELFDHGLEAAARKYAGRPHWGKNHYATAADLRRVYPRFDDFLALRAQMDPRGRFLNRHLRKIFGIEHESFQRGVKEKMAREASIV